MSRTFTADRAAFGLALAALALWWTFPGLTWQPLLLSGLALAARLVSKKPVRLAAPLNLAAGMWLATVGLAAWAAYDRTAAFKLLALALGGVALFYALAWLAPEDLWPVAAVFSGLGGLLSLYFLLAQDWRLAPADMPALNQAGLWWMQVRPQLAWQRLHPNMVAGVLAILFPLTLALGLHYRAQKRRLALFGALFSLALIGGGLLITSSRAAWAALAVGLVCWLALNQAPVQSAVRRVRPAWLGLGLAGAGIVAVAGLFFAVQIAPASADPAGSLASRMELYRNSLYLAQETLWTGAGLGAFAGWYSTYILAINVPKFFYSHNLYLDILVEQGFLGLWAWAGLLLGSGALLLTGWAAGLRPNRPLHPLALPALAGLLVLGLHGLADNPFYEPWSRPLLLLLPGLGAAVINSGEPAPAALQNTLRINFLLILVLFGALSLVQPARAARLANLGALDMARIQLAGWPETHLPTAEVTAQLSEVQPVFQNALRLDAGSAASYRLGLIAYQRRDFDAAVEYLQASELARPRHRGVHKMLGLALTWTGAEQPALDRLSAIPEAAGEMETYAWWWRQENQPDLAARAEQMAARLAQQ